MRKLTSILLVLLLILSLAVGVSADSRKVIDEAELLSEEERSSLESYAQHLTDTYDTDVIILTVWSMDGKDPESFADDYYDEHGCGIGNDHTGILFMLSMEYRDWAISTCGNAIYAVTDYGVEEFFSAAAPDLSEGNYYEAFYAYLAQLEVFLNAMKEGNPIDDYPYEYTGPGSYEHGTQEDIYYYDDLESGPRFGFFNAIISAVTGVFSALIGLSGMKRGMKTAVQQSGAGSYVDGNVNITTRMDIYKFSNTTRTPRNTDTGSRGGGGHSGGGSSVHHSSGGVSHGGGHGKF